MSPVFFTDRDLGKQFPAALRAAGISVETHSDHFAHDSPDEEWLQAVGDRGWIILTHDQRIRYKRNERDAVMVSGLAMFVLVGKVPHSDLALSFIASMGRVRSFLGRHQAPFIAKVYQGKLREDGSTYLPGAIELWLNEEDWLRDYQRP